MYDRKQQTEQGTIKGTAPHSARPFTSWMELPRTALISEFSCLFNSQHNFIGTPQGLSYSITCNGDSFRPRESLPGCDSRNILISFQHQLQLCIAALCSKYFESENSPKEKCFVNLRLEKGRPQLQVLGFWLSSVPTQTVPGREAFADAARPPGYLPVCLELMIYWALNFSHQKQIPRDQKQKSYMALYKIFIVNSWGRGEKQ